MKALGFVGRIAALGGLLLLANCSEQEVVAPLPSLSGSEDAVFLCRDEAGVGHPYSDCPDRDSTDDTKAAKPGAAEPLSAKRSGWMKLSPLKACSRSTGPYMCTPHSLQA